MGEAPTPTRPSYRNDILRALPPDEMARLRPSLTRVRLSNGEVLHEAYEPFGHVYFVEQGLVSMVADVEGATVEVGVVGRDGFVGLGTLIGTQPRSYNRAMVQLPGVAYRIPVQAFVDALPRCPVLHGLSYQALDSMFAQISQTAACNGRHVLHQRLARWLLIAHDRADGDELLLTQEFLAIMLAVRRSGVTIAIQALEKTGAIRHGRGRVLVADRLELEAQACVCYERVRGF